MSVAGKKYIYRNVLHFDGFSSSSLHAQFVCDGVTYDYLYITSDELSYGTSNPMSLDTVYTGGGWVDDDYKTIRFKTDPSSSTEAQMLAEWLSVNAIEQLPASYLVTDDSLHEIADALRSKTGTSTSLEFADDFITEINKLTDTRDATASSASDIRNGKTAYANGQKLTGTFYGKTTISTHDFKLSSSQTIGNGSTVSLSFYTDALDIDSYKFVGLIQFSTSFTTGLYIAFIEDVSYVESNTKLCCTAQIYNYSGNQVTISTSDYIRANCIYLEK